MAFNSLEHKLPGEFVYQGISYSFMNEGLNLQRFDGWKVHESDVLIASYPKSGSTWMSAILPLVLDGGDLDKVRANGPFRERVLHLDLNVAGFPSSREIQKAEPPRVMRTHLPFVFLSPLVKDKHLKTVIVLRNPKDILVSYYHMYCSSEGMGKFKGDFHDFFQLFKARHLQYGDMFDWYLGWWEQRHLENILVVKYEDMVKDCLTVVRDIAMFCDVELDESTVRKIKTDCSISSMRRELMYRHETKEFDTKEHNFYRKGIVGDWKNHFNEEESQLINELCKNKLDSVGLAFQFE